MRMWKRFIIFISQVVYLDAVTRPPGIFIQAPNDVFYKAGETVEMPCVAQGLPQPTYTWKRNGIDFNPSGNDDRVVQLPRVGTIVITRPEDKDEGIFQCFAKNDYGTSLSINVNLREAKLKDFPIAADTFLNAKLGVNLTLNCVPPESIPPPQVFWAIKRSYGGFDAINSDNRVTMDHEYRLRITNVIASDRMDDHAYTCMAMNPTVRKTSQGPQFFIRPYGESEEMRPATYLWASPDDHFGLRGSEFKVKCIFAGNPTPDVHWERTDGAELPLDRAKITSFGMELTIQNLQFEDEGVYECWATNTFSQTRAQRTISIRVESSPFWLREPEDVEIGVGGDAEFYCQAKADPAPQYYWFVNGIALENVKDPRINQRFKRPRPDRIVFSNVNRDDPMVLQCNATNKHGYIWGDAYLNVLSEAPTIIEGPKERLVVAEGSSINLTCQVTGKPDPIITWVKDEQQITGGRYKIMSTGDLFIKQVVLSDAGIYMCKASNIYNETDATGTLLVRRKTRIEQAPMDLEVNAGIDAKFTCSATTDPEEVDKLKITWQKDNKDITTVDQRMTTNRQDNSLTISGTIVRDSGSYTCIASNGLDDTSASAMLTVRDRPFAPSNVDVEKCTEKNATVVWMPGTYNNAPVQYFIIQYNTTFSPDTWTFALQVDSIYNTANVSMTPGTTYAFRVIAYNKLGESNPSFPTKRTCVTQEDVPYSHPNNVRTIGDRPNFLHVEWTPMPQIQQNGIGFQYILQLKRVGNTALNTIQIPISDWRTYQYFYDTQNQVYEPYEITLRAKNGRGDAKKDAVMVIGYTGEAIPSIQPQNFQVLNAYDTSVQFSWEFAYEEINSTPTAIRGEFMGFKIQFWQQGYRSDTFREWDVLAPAALKSRVGRTFNATVEDLLPNTNMEAQIAVMNNYYVSRPTDVIRFKTTPGFPGPVALFQPINIGDNHVNLEWKAPEEDRGDLLGYDIGYQSVMGLDLGEVQERDPQIEDRYTTTAILSGLLADTKYRIHIWARTAMGRGEDYFIEITTTEAGDPQAPRFTITDVSSNYINISWWINPYAKSGTVVYVEYKKEYAAEWMRSTDEVISSWKNITDLEPGTTYVLRVIATNGGVTQASHIEEVTTRGIALASALIGNWGWFLGMMLALLLLIGLIIFFVILFRKGKRFSPRGSPSSSYYGGDAPVTYTDSSRIPKRSADFGPEPKGYSNDYYNDKDYEDHGYSKDGYNDQDYDDRDHDYDEADRRYSRDYDRRDHDDYDRRGHDDSYDRRGHDDSYDRRGHDDSYDRRGHDDSYDRRPPSYTSENAKESSPYEEYERKKRASNNYEEDPEFDYREPHRFDRRGVPIEEQRSRSASKTSLNAAAAPSTFV